MVSFIPAVVLVYEHHVRRRCCVPAPPCPATQRARWGCYNPRCDSVRGQGEGPGEEYSAVAPTIPEASHGGRAGHTHTILRTDDDLEEAAGDGGSGGGGGNNTDGVVGNPLHTGGGGSGGVAGEGGGEAGVKSKDPDFVHASGLRKASVAFDDVGIGDNGHSNGHGEAGGGGGGVDERDEANGMVGVGAGMRGVAKAVAGLTTGPKLQLVKTGARWGVFAVLTVAALTLGVGYAIQLELCTDERFKIFR